MSRLIRNGLTLMLGLAAVLALLATGAGPALGDDDDNGGEPPQVIPVVQINCNPADGTPQRCDPKFVVPFAGQDEELVIRFDVSPTHCSSIKVELFVNGVSQGEGPFLSWFGEPNLPSSFTWSVDVDDGGPPLIELQATGRVGGCNVGALFSWGGILTITSGDDDFDDDGKKNKDDEDDDNDDTGDGDDNDAISDDDDDDDDNDGLLDDVDPSSTFTALDLLGLIGN